MWTGDDPFPPISPAANVQDYWYTYDAANRELVVNGKLTNQGDADASHHIVLDGARDTSYEQHYDAAGDIISRRYNVNGTNYTDRSAYTRQGQLAATWYTNPNNVDDDDADSLAETRHYDAAGQLIEIDRYADPAARAAGADGEPVDIGGRLISETTFNYTADGKLRYQDHFGVTDPWCPVRMSGIKKSAAEMPFFRTNSALKSPSIVKERQKAISNGLFMRLDCSFFAH